MSQEIVNKVIPIDQLKPHPRNYKKHPDTQIKRLMASVTRFSQVRSIVVQEGKPGQYMLVAGHGFTEAAKLQGLKELRADVIPADWTPEQVEGYLVADNLLGATAEDDNTLLAEILQEQANMDYDLASLGSSQEDLDALLAMLAEDALGDMPEAGGGGDEFDTTPEEGPTRSKLGDLWQLGKHRLLVGDCTDAGKVARLMGGEKADMVFTDPPYNVAYGSNSNNPKYILRVIANDDMSGSNWLEFSDRYMRAIFANCTGSIYICMSDKELASTTNSFIKSGGHWSSYIIWVKNQFVMGMKDYHSRHETILYGWPEGVSHYFIEERNHDDVWEFDRPKSSEDHPTMKPVGLVEQAISYSSKTKSLILDPFLGSGTTLIAAQRTNRKCYGMEISEKYADVILKRWEAETGQTAKLFERIEQPELMEAGRV